MLYQLLVVFDETNNDACRAVEILDRCGDFFLSLRQHHEELAFEGWSVAFMASPPAPATLRRALHEGIAVGVFATHRPHIKPSALVWHLGATLVEATDIALGFRPSPFPSIA